MMWFSHPDFKNFILNEWDANYGNLESNTTRLASIFSHWNFSVFGNIFKLKRRLLARITCVQNWLAIGHNRRLIKLEIKLRNELDCVLHHEKVLWFQKSRKNWIRSGDKNTWYYHASTVVRRNRNKVEALKDSNDIWVDNLSTLKNLVNNFFNLCLWMIVLAITVLHIRDAFLVLTMRCLSLFKLGFTRECGMLWGIRFLTSLEIPLSLVFIPEC